MGNEPQGAGIIKIDPWLSSPAGRYLLAWEQAQIDRLVADLFGFHAVQLGWPALDALRANRMPHRWLLCDTHGAAMVGRTPHRREPPGALADAAAPAAAQPEVLVDFEALPFAAQTLDLVVMPHTLELAADPHQALREVERVLMPEGRVVVFGFNPASLWGARQCWGRPFLPHDNELLSRRRLRDWLRLLGLEVEAGRFGCYRPPLRSAAWLERWRWMDPAGDRWWPVLGSVYCLQAVKRVQGMRLVGRIKSRRAMPVAAPAIATPQVPHLSQTDQKMRTTR